MHSGEQRWEGIGVCRAHCSRYSKECAGDRKVSHRHLVKMSLVVFSILTRNIHFFPLSYISLSVLIQRCCGSLEHATAVNTVLVQWGKKGNPSAL